MLKRLSGMSKSAIKKTRSILGADDEGPGGAADGAADGASGENEVAAGAADDPRADVPAGNASGERDAGGGRRAGDTSKKRAGKASGKGGAAHDPADEDTPRIVPRAEHPVSRKAISRSALKVLDRLHEGGFGAYLVGGGVRDALVGIAPKDFDIATDASPEDVRSLFRNSRIIGRRFRLVHVVFGREIIEVATFRAAHDKGEGGEVGASGRIVRDNVYGSIAEDARRRDFSVNALYYNVADRSVVDYVGGLEDIENKLFRLIGDPLTRCEEDPVRVLRAVRLSAKLRFAIEPASGAAMKKVAPELRHTPPARLFEEVLKLFQGGYAERSFAAVVEHDLLRYVFPLLAERLARDEDPALRTMIDAALANTDRRVAQDKPITPAYLLAFMLWPDVEERARAGAAAGLPLHEALRDGADEVLARQLKVISIPRRFSGPMKEIWQMQPRLERNRGRRALALMEDRRFRAAYDFLCLRAKVDPRLEDSAAWWTRVQDMPGEEREGAAAGREPARGIWGDGAAGESAELPPVVSDDAVGGDAPGGRRRRRGGRRRGGGRGGASEVTPGGDAPGAARPGEGADDRTGARTGGEGRGEVTGRQVDAPNATDGPASATSASGAAEGVTADTAPKRKRRRRRRKPGGDSARPPGGDG